MALTINSTIGELVADEKAKAILEKHIPGISTNPQLGMVTSMTLRGVAPMSEGMINEAQIKAIEEDLEKL